MRLNRALALRKITTRAHADELISAGKVYVNGTPAKIGQKVDAEDKVEVRQKRKAFRYFAFNKPRGIITHSPAPHEKDIQSMVDVQNIFPIGRLDKDSSGLIILTDDGRITDPLLNPEFDHEKEYEVCTREPLATNFKSKMERGVRIGTYITKPCTVRILGNSKFSIILSEGKKHQIRRMCDSLGNAVTSLRRTRIVNVRLDNLKPGAHRAINGKELETFLSSLGI